MKLTQLILMCLLCSSAGSSQNIFVKNIEDRNEVKCHYENKFLIQSICTYDKDLTIEASSGDVRIVDSLLTWSNIMNCYANPFLIVNRSDTLSFNIGHPATPKFSLVPKMLCNDVSDYPQRFEGLRAESNEYEILDFDFIFYNSENQNPIYLKNGGATLNKVIRKRIQTSTRGIKLLIFNVRLVNRSTLSISLIDDQISLSNRYFKHNTVKGDFGLREVAALTFYIQNDASEKLNSDCWLSYQSDGDYTDLVDKSNSEIRASYRRDTSGNVSYKHYKDSKLILSGKFKLVKTPYYNIVVDFDTYEEAYEEFSDLVKDGIWKEFDREGTLFITRKYLEGVLVEERYLDKD